MPTEQLDLRQAHHDVGEPQPAGTDHDDTWGRAMLAALADAAAILTGPAPGGSRDVH
jgi:hypothetical protein